MKKNGLVGRTLALLLALAMVLPMVPVSAFAAVGDLDDGDNMALPDDASGVSNTDTVNWPVKIYDYLNDGMLFEYAQANDETAEINLAYGGGMPMPFQDDTMIGSDYTQNSTYNDRAWGFWAGDSHADVTTYAAVDDVSPRYIRVTYTGTYDGRINVTLSDFLNDNSARQDKDDIRYFVIVYRTGGGYTAQNYHLNWMVGGTYDATGGNLSSGTRYFSDNTDKLPASKDENTWTYYVVDMKTDYSTDTYTGIAEGWSSIGSDSVTGVRTMLPLDTTGEYMDISHIAYFSSAEEAAAFGEKALVFNNDPGVYIESASTYSAPSVSSYGWDFTTASSSSWSDSTYTAWSSSDGMTTKKVAASSTAPTYMNVTNSDSDNPDVTYVFKSSGVSKSSVRYITVVYRTYGISSPRLGFWIECSSYPYAAGKGMGSNTTIRKSITASTSDWVFVTYDLATINSADTDYSSISKVTNIGIYFPGFTSTSQSMDIAYIDYFSSSSDASAFGTAATNYLNNYTGGKTWNMGNNTAYAMLYASGGGGWDANVTGGSNDDPNGYYSYSIGELIAAYEIDGTTYSSGWGSTTSETVTTYNNNRPSTSKDDQIYMIYPAKSASGWSINNLSFDGYELFGNVIQTGTTLFTAGLIEPALETVEYSDGSTSKRIVYREETIGYIADVLQKTLVIPRFDSDGNPNYNYVRGAASTQFGTDSSGNAIDLATALRGCLGITFTGANKGTATAELGSYAETVAKAGKLTGAFLSCKDSIETFYDAAYYLLNNLFIKNSYNEAQDDYAYLQLNKVEGTDDTYIFDGGFTTSSSASAVDYGTDQILNLYNAVSKYKFVYEVSSSGYQSYTTLHPFLPVTDALNNNNTYPDATWTPYFADDGVSSVTNGKNSYVNRNFNYVMATNGEFHYYAEDELFFEFEGDDDVYLFLNGQLVLDIGGAHSIAAATFDVNDYVDWAWGVKTGGKTYDGTTATETYENLSDAEKARVDAFALNDGDVCSFDFYYMERHGFGANCRIMTNIHVTDPAMDVTKSAYQDDVQVSEGGIINKDQPVEYGFAMTNNGDASLYQLVFTDTDIGLELSWDEGLKITGSNVCDVNGEDLEVTDLVAVITHPDYDDITVTFADNQALMDFLADGTAAGMQSGKGLFVGSTVLIRGFAYKLTDKNKEAGKFFNTVKAEANSQPDGTGKPLISEDDMRVYIAAEPMYYQWAEHDLEVTWTKLKENIISAAGGESGLLAGDDRLEAITGITSVAEVNSNGSSRDYPYVEVDSTNKKITINYVTPGSYVFYVQIGYTSSSGSGTATIPVLVNVADVEDSIFVLDYGLNAILTENNELYKNDTLTVPARASTHTLLGIGETTPSYSPNNITFTEDNDNTIGDDNDGTGYDGIFTLSGSELSYKPTDFMDQRDQIWLAVSVHETGFTSTLGTTDINKEAQMFKSVKVLPATVVYYEDDFPAIKYSCVTDTGVEEVSASLKTVTGTGSSSLNQNVDQDQEYGQDSNYQNNSDMSGDSLHTITIRDSNNFASFTFTGTGFELIGSTRADNPAAIAVTVMDSENNVVKRIPVITEFDNNEDGNSAGGAELIYQVPVIRVEDLDYGTYTVHINGIPTYDFDSLVENEDGSYSYTVTDSYFYLDGLRIFEPLATTENGEVNPGKAEEYLDTENDATFLEVREEIMNGNVATATYSETSGVSVSSALKTWTENLNGTTYEGATFTGNEVSSIEDYLIKGPNNEVYMNGDLSETALIFYVKEDADATVHNLQIAVHAIDAAKFYIGATVGSDSASGMNADIRYGVKVGDTYTWKELVKVTSGTEQYYTIPYTECPYSEDKGAYQVAIYVESGMASFTSLKVNGLELQAVSGGDSTTLYYDNGILKDAANDTPVAMALYLDYEMVGYQMSRATVETEEEPEETTEPSTPETEPEETTEPTTPETEPEETTEPTTPETEHEKPDSGNKPGNNQKPNDNKPGSSNSGSNANKLWQALKETIDYLKKLLGRG